MLCLVSFGRLGFLPGPFLWGKKNILKNIVIYLVLNNIVLYLLYQITIKKQHHEIDQARNRKEKRKIQLFNR
jgi:hypothetical protein